MHDKRVDWIEAFALALCRLHASFGMQAARDVGGSVFAVHGDSLPEKAARKYPFTSPPPEPLSPDGQV